MEKILPKPVSLKKWVGANVLYYCLNLQVGGASHGCKFQGGAYSLTPPTQN